MCVLFFAVGVKLVFHGFDEEQDFRDESLMCFFAAASLILMYIMAALHRGFMYNFELEAGRLWHFLYRFFVAATCTAIPFFSPSSTVTVILLHVLTTGLVLQDIMLRSTRVHLISSWLDLSYHTKSKVWNSVMDSSITDPHNFNIGVMDTSADVLVKSAPLRKWWAAENGNRPSDSPHNPPSTHNRQSSFPSTTVLSSSQSNTIPLGPLPMSLITPIQQRQYAKSAKSKHQDRQVLEDQKR